jgi:hypothetical protein
MKRNIENNADSELSRIQVRGSLTAVISDF